MVTYGGMSKKPITVSTSSFIFKVSLSFFPPLSEILLLWLLLLGGKYIALQKLQILFFFFENCELVWVGGMGSKGKHVEMTRNAK